MTLTLLLLVAAIVIVLCVVLNNVSNKIGIPMLLAFILLGMAFGSDGIVKIPFDNFDFTESICTVALIFIMFYGGFGTRWKEAKPVVVKAGILSTLGVALTAGLTGLSRPPCSRFCAPASSASNTTPPPSSRSRAVATTPAPTC